MNMEAFVLGCSGMMPLPYRHLTSVLLRREGDLFLFDGGDLYFFLDEVTLKIGDSEIKLSPMSYVVAKYNNSISYYDKKNDTDNNMLLEYINSNTCPNKRNVR